MTSDLAHTARAAVALDDDYRLWLVLRALKFDPHTPYRRDAVREFIELTEPDRRAA